MHEPTINKEDMPELVSSFSIGLQPVTLKSQLLSGMPDMNLMNMVI